MKAKKSNIPAGSERGDTEAGVRRASKCPVRFCPNPCLVEAINAR